jgi:predicted ATPase
MSDPILPNPDADAPTRIGFEDHIRRFERDWAAGLRPDMDAYLPGPGLPPRGLLVELVHIDLEFRLKAGEPVRAGHYLARFPQLATDPDVAADLIAAEFELRRRDEPGLSFDEIAAAYPEYGGRLATRTDRHHASGGASTATAGGRWPSAPGYELLDRLGAGGMGVVYRARDERLGRVVALKFLPAEYARDPARLALFHREARTASALNHPHICTVHDLGECEGRPFIVLEFVEGRTLRALLAERPAAEEVARLVGQTARALAVAHAAGVVHRDIKPENLMVRADGYLKVLDFGLARRIPGSALPGMSTARSTDPAGFAGTAQYMSPEQARSQIPGPASDVFSLGIVLYELVTGRHPFPGEVPLDILNAIVDDTPAPASELNPAVPPALDALLGRMLAKNPADRPSAAEVDAALCVLADAESVPPAPPPPPARRTVGRAAERAELANALTAAFAGNGGMVCVAGEPGIGKTTLVEEFLAELASEGRPGHVARGRCSERLAEAEAYLPVLEALDSLLRGPGGSVAGRYLRTLAPTWAAELGLADAADRPAEEPAPASTTQTRLKRELIAFLTELGRRGPVVLFLDDLHCADLPTTDLLAYLGRHCPGMRLLLVVAYRRDELLLADHPFVRVMQDLQGRRVSRELAPPLLGAADVERYLELAFPGHGFPPELAEVVHARTGGNPLFVAELARFLRDGGAIEPRDGGWVLARPVAEAAAGVPGSVRGLIRRKLDQFAPGERSLLATAAVQGAEFDSAALARAAGQDPAAVEELLQQFEQVHGLVRLIREQEFPDRTASRRYGFVHAVYREALAADLPPARRAAVSRALADALWQLHDGRPGLAAAGLALLYEAGREFLRAAELFHAAAENAARVFAHREAAALARRGLGLLRGLPESPELAAAEFHLSVELGLQLQITEGFAAAEVEAAYTRARAVWERSPAVGQPFPILWGLWLVYKVRADVGRAQKLAGQLLTLATEVGDPALILQARQAGAIVALCCGDPAGALRHADAGAALYDPGRHRPLTFRFGQDPGVACLAFGAVALWQLGEAREAVARSRDAVRLGREGSQPSTLALALHFAAVLHQLRGDPAAVREFASESLSVAVEHRLAFWQAGATVLLGWAAAAAGAGDGTGLIEDGIGTWRATGSVTYRAYYLILLADARRRAGRTADALAALDEAERTMAATGERFCDSEARRVRAELSATGGPRGE